MKQYPLIKNSKGGDNITTTLDPLSEVFREQGQGFYVWCNEGHLDKVLSGDITVIKVGQYGTNAKDGKLPQDTIEEYSGTTTEAQVIVYAKKLTAEEINKVGSAFALEQKFHSKNRYRRNPNGKSKESYNITLPEVVAFFAEELYSDKDLANFGLRPSQQQAVSAMAAARNAGHSDFLLGAVMRFGKNHTFLEDCRNHVPLGGSVLIFTNKPTVFSSLEDDINTHANYVDYDFVSLKEDRQWTPKEDKVNVLAVSKQLFDNPKNKTWVSQLIKEAKFEAAFIDECHSGTQTENFSKDALPCLDTVKFRVYASGTPFKAVAGGKFTKANSYFYDYIDQQRDKKNGIIKAVTLETYIPLIDKDILNDPRFTEEEGFKFSKFLATDEAGNFINEGQVKKFIECVFSTDSKPRFSPYSKKGDIQHAIALCPSVAAIKALAELINKTSEFRAIPATAELNKDIEEVKQKISDYEREGFRTITLTFGRFVEGSTEPRWKAAFLFSETSGLEKYLQFIFRPTSIPHGEDKDKAYVFDFNPERALSMAFGVAMNRAQEEGNTDPSEYIREYLDCHPIFIAKEGNTNVFEEVDTDRLISEVRNTDFAYQQIQKDSCINEDALYNALDRLSGADIDTQSDAKEFLVSSNGIEGAKTFEVIGGKKGDKVDKTDLELAIKNTKAILSYIPFPASYLGIGTLEEFLEVIDEETWKDLTGMDKKWLDILVQENIINVAEVNLILYPYRNVA